MRTRLRYLSSLLRIEFGVSWRFPVLEGLAAIIFYGILSYTLTSRYRSSFDIYLGDTQRVVTFLDGLASNMLQSGMQFFFTSLALIIPVLVALAVARPFEDGFYRTHLTLPVTRANLLLTKAGLVILIPASLLSFALLTVVALTFPLLPTATDLLLVIVATWLYIAFLVSISTLIAVQTRKLTTAMLGGVGLWSVALSLLSAEGIPSLATFILNPLSAVTEFITQGTPVMEDLQIGMVVSFVITVVLFILSLVIFERTEV